MKKSNLFKLAVNNLRRKLVRTILLMLVAAVVSGTLLGATVFIFGMQNALKIGTYRLGADILVVPAKNEEQARTALLAGKPTSFYMDRQVLEKIKKLEGVKQASPSFLSSHPLSPAVTALMCFWWRLIRPPILPSCPGWKKMIATHWPEIR